MVAIPKTSLLGIEQRVDELLDKGLTENSYDEMTRLSIELEEFVWSMGTSLDVEKLGKRIQYETERIRITFWSSEEPPERSRPMLN